MKSADIAPDCTRLFGPVHACNTVMVPGDEPHDVFSNHLILVRIHVIDLGNVETHTSKDRLPTRHRMCSDDWMRRRKLVPSVEGRSTWRHDIVLSSISSAFEDGLRACGSQSLEVGPELGREAIVQLIPRYPEGISPSWWS